MIQSLTVKNIALIDELNIEFGNGLNVLSGETGAGKSIVVDSMNLLLGERADRELIRSGQEKAHVEANICIDSAAFADFFDENELEADDELIISRDLSVSGKNVCRINGTVVSLATLKTLMDRIVDLHGQHEHQSLLYAKNHILFLDNYCGKKAKEAKGRIAQLYTRLKNVQRQLDETGGDERERMRSMDLLSFQIQEITEAKIFAGEEDALRDEREKLNHAQFIAQTLSNGYAELYLGGEEGGSALSLVQDAVRLLSQIAIYDAAYEKTAERLQESAFVLEECAHDLRGFSESIVFDEQRQTEIEERIDLLGGLKRKYGNSEKEILAFCTDAQQKLEKMQHAEEEAARLTSEIIGIQDQLYAEYQALSGLRKEAAKKLSAAVLKELNDLGMPGANFEAKFAPLPGRKETVWHRDGIDEMEFYLSTNEGEPLKPLSKTASGGEISRVMLAFKNISAGSEDISTLIFDEIDTGISGRMALVVSEKMASISRSRQVICVTHLPQIAAMADANFLIRKYSADGATHTNVARLEGANITDEIARLAGGIETENALKYAGELRQNAEKIKRAFKG
ncbi:DNA repair protein RecN [Christensenella tenuis]|uniref:DNA repair protein RecN n=1 Tax=Christensenella tenuis TaxID=2763033 RepID=A0ABR7EBR0_9FIRM|nr:DNA repair protein RecN [Christensenella tenuis]MBC5647207.1 DNA repair protein RecN [Christensenella tenuis]